MSTWRKRLYFWCLTCYMVSKAESLFWGERFCRFDRSGKRKAREREAQSCQGVKEKDFLRDIVEIQKAEFGHIRVFPIRLPTCGCHSGRRWKRGPHLGERTWKKGTFLVLKLELNTCFGRSIIAPCGQWKSIIETLRIARCWKPRPVSLRFPLLILPIDLNGLPSELNLDPRGNPIG